MMRLSVLSILHDPFVSTEWWILEDFRVQHSLEKGQSQGSEGAIMDLMLITSVRASLMMVQWLRICLAMQGTRVQSLVWEDFTCCGAT